MKIIKLTSLSTKKPIYLNADMIGHFFEVAQKLEYGRVDKEKHTKVGVVTHNNGGFEVVESVDEIIKKVGGCVA